MKANSITPKCASVSGKIEVRLAMDIDPKIVPFMDDVIVGFL